MSELLHAADRIRIVLVGTQHPGNIGSAARAMKTMGLHRLVLVAPERYPHADASAMAAGADDVLAARVLQRALDGLMEFLPSKTWFEHQDVLDNTYAD